MAASASNLQRTMKTLGDEATAPESKTQALNSLRRTYLEDKNNLKSLKDEEFCELCNSVINASVTEDEKLHIEACRTLDIVLPESRIRNFDFFQSILQINRKKRLKILVSLNILKDETVVTIASNLSILVFLNDCMQSIQPKSMTWLLSENAENGILLKNIENKIFSESEDFEEKVVERALQLLGKLINLSSAGLNIRQFDIFIMEKVIPLAYMGHQRQRTQALIVTQLAVKNDLGIRVRSIHKEIWDKYKATLQNVYCKRMSLLVNISHNHWAALWETSITLIGMDLHRGSGLVNSLLKVEELAFKSADPNRRQAFLSWKLLIDNFALDQRELATNRRIKLLCVPLNAKNSKTEMMVLTKLEVWWHLIYKVYPSLASFVDTIMVPYLNLCFGPLGDKPLFVPKTDATVSLGKKFTKTQIFAVDAFVQLIVSKEDQSKISSSITEKLTGPVSSLVFEAIHKLFIHSFGEIVIIFGQFNDNDYKDRLDVCKLLWDNLVKRIDEYDKMKVPMYKEVMNVITELCKSRFHKISFIKDFLLNVVSKNFDDIAFNTHFSENMLKDLVHTILQVDNFSSFLSDHYPTIESLLWHLIKPKNSDIYYPQTLKLVQGLLEILDNASKFNSHIFAACEMWCVLARISKKYAEDSQNINEGTLLERNFKTFERILAFPFTSLHTDDHDQLRRMAEAWIDLYKQFDFQAELIVTVKPNEITDKTSNMIIAALKKDKKCCDFASICIDALLTSVNYDNLPNDKEVPAFVQLLKDLILQCLLNESFATDRVLRALSAFLLRVFSHNAEKTALYLKNIEPAIKFMLAKIDDSNLEREIVSTWNTIVSLFKKLEKCLNYELLNCYRKIIVFAILHLNLDISSMAFSILDLKENVDEKSKKVLEDIIKELEETSVKTNFDIEEIKGKSKKVKSVVPIGSFLNRKTMSPSKPTIVQNGKENVDKIKVNIAEPDSQDFVVINTDIKMDVNRLTEHQKEMFKKRRDDIPAMYNDLTVSNSQDTQELQHWFDTKATKLPDLQKNKTLTNSNEIPKTPTASFRNITQVLSNDQTKDVEKPVVPVTSASPKSSKKQQPTLKEKEKEKDADASTIEDSQKEGSRANAAAASEPAAEAPIAIAKKLDFNSRDEFPPSGPGESEQVSPSIIDNAKMRRRNPSEESTSTGAVQDKNTRQTRRSLQPQQQPPRSSLRNNLRRSNSTEQLNKRGKKRRNSESNSEGMLGIEREKRPRREITPETQLSSGESINFNEESKSTENADVNKGLTKRQLIEMSRLKIDMRFEPLPSRRSIGKANDTTTAGTTDKKTSTVATTTDKKVATVTSVTDKKATTVSSMTDKKAATVASTIDKKATTVASSTDKKAATVASTTDKKATTVASTIEKKASAVASITDKKSISAASTADKKAAPATSSKEEKSKEEKIITTPTKADTNNQHLILSSKRRSMKGSVSVNEKETLSTSHKRDSGHKKPAHPEHLNENNKLTTRSSTLAKVETVLKKIEQPQEEIQIMDVSIKENHTEKVDNSEKVTTIEIDETEDIETNYSQDSDIVESSQEPTISSKLDKVECFIKIKKVEVFHNLKPVEELPKEDAKIIQATPDLDETSISVIPASVEPENHVPVQPEMKKAESNVVKPSIPINHTNVSPKSTISNSRLFRSKPFSLQGRAAHMIGLVTKQSLAEKLADSSKMDISTLDEITVIPISKKDKAPKDNEKVSSPSGSGSRQEKIFSNMNNLRQERSSSPAMVMFCNLRNDGERISPKLDKHEREKEVNCSNTDKETSQNGNDDSPGKVRKELPMLEWSNANPPSLTASPSVSILKRMQEYDVETPNRKKRVSFADPPVSREMGYEIMTESSSPPKLERLPTTRSPISRKEYKKHARLRLNQIDPERFEKENEQNSQSSNMREKPLESSNIGDAINISSDVSITSIPSKLKLATVLTEISLDESRIVEIDNNSAISQTPDVDIFVENTHVSVPNESIEIKTSTQTDQNNSSVKLDSINISNIFHKSDSQQTLEDTVDANNISSSLDGSISSDKPVASYSQSSVQSDTLPVTDSVFSNHPLSQETQNSIARLNEPENLDSTLPVYPSLTSCGDAIDAISVDLVDPLFTNNLAKHLSVMSIHSVGDLAQLTEREVDRLPIKSPKISYVKKALSRYEEKMRSRTPERRPTNTVPSSTPLGTKRRNQSKSDSDSYEELVNTENNNSESDLASINVSAVYAVTKRPQKRHSTDSSMQTSPVKKVKKSNEEACTELMDQCDDAFLYKAFIERFDADRILKGYREKMNDKTEKELKKQTLSMLGLSSEDDSEASFKASSKCAGLQRVLQLLPKIFNADDEFIDTVLTAYKKKLKAQNVLEFLKLSEVKEAVVDKFSSTELINILVKRLDEYKEKGVGSPISNKNDVQVLLNRISYDSLFTHVKTRNDLNSSEALLSLTLENCNKNLSKNIKTKMFETLTERLDVCELADMYNEAIKAKVRKLQDK